MSHLCSFRKEGVYLLFELEEQLGKKCILSRMPFHLLEQHCVLCDK